jgi:hypothetical protein
VKSRRDGWAVGWTSVSIVPNGTWAIFPATFPSDESLGYSHHVPAGHEDTAKNRTRRDVGNDKGSRPAYPLAGLRA